MAPRRTSWILAAAVVLGACGSTPADLPDSQPMESGPTAVLDEARSVVADLEERQVQLDSQMRNPFSQP